MRKSLVLLAALTLVVGMLAPASADGAMDTTADVVGQGPDGDVVAGEGATLKRTDNGIKPKIKMPTPESGTYDYPDPYTEDGDETVSEPGHPEGFTLWVFVFDDELGGFGGHPWSSAFLGAGHIVGGDTLTLSGHINENTEPFAGFHLKNPRDVKVHLAVAPHGEVDDEIMPDQIKTPGGGPQHWWHAFFDPTESD